MEKEQDAKSLRKRLAERYRQPPQKNLIVLRGQGSATVYACRKILLYSPERIELRVGKSTVVLRGRGLICSAFTGGAVAVKGLILGISFEGISSKEEEKTNLL